MHSSDENEDLDRAALRLLEAQRTRVACEPVRGLFPHGKDDLASAYAVQWRLTQKAVEVGRRRVGRKIGLTSPSVQQQFGVDQPDYGVLFDDMHVASRGAISLGQLIQPKVEAEIAFILGQDLDVGPITPELLRASVDQVTPALEIVDSRIRSWDITIADTIADNASSGLFVLGSDRHRLADRDLRPLRMEMHVDGQVMSTGTGADCLGDPVMAAAWLAQTSLDNGDPLRAGEVILTGALGPMVAVEGEAEVVADIAGLGRVSVTFETGGPEQAATAEQGSLES